MHISELCPHARRLGVAALLAVTIGGCGSSGSDHGQGHPSTVAGPRSRLPITAPFRGELQAGLLGGAQSAGAAPSYTPSGRIVADSGFRPQVNGFSFENYGNDAGPVNLTAQNVEDMFGPQVCASGEGPSCTLIPRR